MGITHKAGESLIGTQVLEGSVLPLKDDCLHTLPTAIGKSSQIPVFEAPSIPILSDELRGFL